MKKRVKKKGFRITETEFDRVTVPWLITEYNLVIEKKSSMSVSQRQAVEEAVKKLIKMGELFELYNKKVERMVKKVEMIIVK